MGRVWSCENRKSGWRPCYLMGKATHAPTESRAGEWSRVVVDPGGRSPRFLVSYRPMARIARVADAA